MPIIFNGVTLSGGYEIQSVVGPTTIGEPYGGGFYAGLFNANADSSGIATHYLVVSNRAEGESAGKTWSQADSFCAGLISGGYDDWYMPSKDELEVVYFNLKPDAVSNWVQSGSNPSAVPPEPIDTNYTLGSPAQTSALAFRTSGQVDQEFSFTAYWTSTLAFVTPNVYMWCQDFIDGYQSGIQDSSPYYIRAIRRVPI